MDKQTMLKALESLDKRLPDDLRLIIAGGAAMLLCYGHSESTADIDAAPQPFKPLADYRELIEAVATDLDLPFDWLNPHFTDFTHVVPECFTSRTQPVFEGRRLQVLAFGPEDISIMKLIAGRPKDRPHLRRLFRLKDFNFELVEDHLYLLRDQNIPKADEAIDLLGELRDEL